MKDTDLIETANNEPTITRGEVYADGEHNYRVVDIRKNGIMLITLSPSAPAVKLLSCKDFFFYIENGNYKKIIETDEKIPEINPKDVEKHNHTRIVLEKFLDDVWTNCELLFTRNAPKRLYDDVLGELKISKRSFRRLLLKYLRSGRDISSLADQRQFNKRPAVKLIVSDDPLEDTDLLYKEGLRVFKETKSVQTAFDYLKLNYYRQPEIIDDKLQMRLIPEEEMPVNYNKLYHYIKKNLGGKSINEYKAGARDTLNNSRMLPGTVSYGTSRLGDIFEADECELPCYIVDPDTGSVVGKAIVYVIADVRCGIITGCYVSYDNNSYIGLRQAFLSMLEPHHMQTDKYGLKYKEHEFPSLCIPRELRCDHGAEYESHAVKRAMEEMGITLSLVPVACGSFKGLVESINNRLQIIMKTHLQDAGIVRDVYRGGDIAKGNAVLTLEDLREIVYNCVLYINRRPRADFTPDLDMMKAKIGTSPAAIYEYEMQKTGDPKNVTDNNRNRFMYSLIARENDRRRFTISKRKGICYRNHNLYYFSQEAWFIDMLNDTKDLSSIEVRYEDSDVSAVYVKYKNVIRKVPLSDRRENQQSFGRLTWDEYDKLYDEFKNSEAYVKCNEDSANEKMELIEKVEKIGNMAKVLNGQSDHKYGKAKKEDRTYARTKLKRNDSEIIPRMYSGMDNGDEDFDTIDVCEQPAIPVSNYKETELDKRKAQKGPNSVSVDEETDDLLAKLMEVQ